MTKALSSSQIYAKARAQRKFDEAAKFAEDEVKTCPYATESALVTICMTITICDCNLRSYCNLSLNLNATLTDYNPKLRRRESRRKKIRQQGHNGRLRMRPRRLELM